VEPELVALRRLTEEVSVAVPPEVRIPLESQQLMRLYQPALGQSLDAFTEAEKLLLHGYGNVGNCAGYYLITNLGVHYCDSEKAGLFKRRYVNRFFPRSRMVRAIIDQIAGPHLAFLRIYDHESRMVLVMQFDEEPWQDRPCLDQAEQAAHALGFG
jgi:hypothetical protein